MDIEKRLETLEKKLRLHKRLWMGAACALAVAIVIGATKPIPKVIEAEKFVLKDAKGAEKGLWHVTPTGSEFMMAEGENRKLRCCNNHCTNLLITCNLFLNRLNS